MFVQQQDCTVHVSIAGQHQPVRSMPHQEGRSSGVECSASQMEPCSPLFVSWGLCSRAHSGMCGERVEALLTRLVLLLLLPLVIVPPPPLQLPYDARWLEVLLWLLVAGAMSIFGGESHVSSSSPSLPSEQ